MAFPSSSITRGITFLRCRIYFMHLALSTVSQNCRIPSTSSALVRGFTSRLIYSFNSCHRFSMGFKSGDSAGVFHQWIAFDSMNSFPWFDVCLGSLSCMNLWLVPYTSLTRGRRVCSRSMEVDMDVLHVIFANHLAYSREFFSNSSSSRSYSGTWWALQAIL